MIRFTWIQARTQTITALGALAALAIVLAITGPHLAHLHDMSIATCAAHGDCPAFRAAFLRNDSTFRTALGVVVIVVPALIGIFWGAPLIARELEAGTFRLIWSQSVTRTSWLAAKLGVVGLASMAIAGLRMDPYGTFDQRGIVPIGYAAFGFALGVTAGMLIRRTVPAMATALVLFVSARLAFTHWLRPHLIAPAHHDITITTSQAPGSTPHSSSTEQGCQSPPASCAPPARPSSQASPAQEQPGKTAHPPPRPPLRNKPCRTAPRRPPPDTTKWWPTRPPAATGPSSGTSWRYSSRLLSLWPESASGASDGTAARNCTFAASNPAGITPERLLSTNDRHEHDSHAANPGLPDPHRARRLNLSRPTGAVCRARSAASTRPLPGNPANMAAADGASLGAHAARSGRCPPNRGVPLVADVNGTLMAQRLRPIETGRASDFSSQIETVSVVDLVKAPITD